MKERGLSKIIVIQSKSKIQADLLQVLLSWQAEGMSIATQKPWEPWNPLPVKLNRPPIAVHLWRQLMRKVGLSKNLLGSGSVKSFV